jgi:DNA-binding beta-propeller fold protein YncE
MRHPLRLVCVTAALAAVCSFTSPVQADSDDDDHSIISYDGLDGPRGLAVADGKRIVWAEADGTVKIARKDRVRTLGSVPAGFIAPAVAADDDGRVWVLTTGGEPGTGAATLYRWKSGEFRVVADIAAFQAAHPDPYNIEGDPKESNPYGVAALEDGRGVLVADAAHNNVLKVSKHGKIKIVAWLKPRVVPMPAGFPAEIENPETGELEPLPPAGTPIPSESVPTSVTVGEDGDYYVGELRGFPATPGTSRIWEIEEGSTNAICDPEAPDEGDCEEFADGLTSIVDLAPADDDGIYAVSLVNASWFAWEVLQLEPIGGVWLVEDEGEDPEAVDTGEPLILPGGIDVDSKERIWVSGPIFGPGSVHTLP